MKKQLLLAFAVLAAFTTLKAGNMHTTYGGGSSNSKLTIGVSVGAAIPMGAYGSTDTAGGKSAIALRENTKDSTSAIGYAKTGFHFDITAGYLFSDNIGGMIYIGGNMNSFDASTLKTQNQVTSPATVTVKNYYTGQYLIGPFASFGGDKLKINVRLLAGLVKANTPEINYNNGQSGAFAGTSDLTGKSGSGFGYQLGAGIMYGFSDKMGLTVNVAYTGASLKYTGYSSTDTFSGSSSTHDNTTLKSTMSLGILTATVGLAFNL